MIAKKLLLICVAIVLAGPALAQVELKAYADRDGYIDVQKLTCAQLAGTFQEDADYLAAWYSGWYNGLAKKHVMQAARARALQHEVIVQLQGQSRQKGHRSHRCGLQGLSGRAGHQDQAVIGDDVL